MFRINLWICVHMQKHIAQIWVVQSDTCPVTWHFWSRDTENISCSNEALIESSFYLPSPSRSNDIWGENYISFFDQRYETCPVIYFYLSSKIFSIYIFNIRIKNSNNSVIYLFTNSRAEKNSQILPFTAQFRKKYKYFRFYFTFAWCDAVCSGCVYW